MVSIEDVAKYAGVSIATVSRVLNRTGYVSEETELRVLKAVNELDSFEESEIKQSLKYFAEYMVTREE